MVKKIAVLLALVLVTGFARAQAQFSMAYLADPVPAPFTLTTQSASISNTSFYTTPAVAGYYRVCMFEEITRAATTSSNLPQMGIAFTSGVDSVSKFLPVGPQSGLGGNQVFTTWGACSAPFFAAASTAIFYAALNYSSSGATSMQYDLSIELKQE